MGEEGRGQLLVPLYLIFLALIPPPGFDPEWQVAPMMPPRNLKGEKTLKPVVVSLQLPALRFRPEATKPKNRAPKNPVREIKIVTERIRSRAIFIRMRRVC